VFSIIHEQTHFFSLNFCSHCGSSDLEFKIPEGDNRLRHICPSCGTIHYQNPRVIVGSVPIWENKIMLCRRNIEPRFGLWNLPSGFLENGETVEEGALRELKEESMAEGEILGLHSLYNLPHANQVYVHFLVALNSNYFELTPESSEIEFFDPPNIPYSDMAFSSSTFSIKKYLENVHSTNPKVHIGTYVKS